MEESINLKIPTESNHSEFLTHLQFDDNYRILFSGIFGSGKTTFLKEFFEKYKESYEVFYLYPVNYQVASNADIFEYIKYDLLFHIIDRGWIPVGEEFSKSLALQFYLLKKGPSFLLNMLKSVPGNYISKGAESIEKLSKFIKAFSTHYDEIDKNPDLAKIETFLSEMNNKPGSIYELDSISQIIYNTISNKEEKEKQSGNENENKQKQNVLVIDDLDRIDPEHIFRILNVFSAHFDIAKEDKNKFNFDKIILVCDIQNIRNIFHHRYGSSVDFSGYADKFYSKKIFTFDLSNEIEKVIDSHIAIIAKYINADSYKNMLKSYVSYLIHCFIALRICTPRDITKFKYAGNTNYKEFSLSSNSNVKNYELLIPIIFDILSEIFGNKYKIHELFNHCIDGSNEIEKIGNKEFYTKVLTLNSALFLYAINNPISYDEQFKHEFGEITMTCQIKLTPAGNTRPFYTADNIQGKELNIFNIKTTFKILIEAFTNYMKIKDN